MVFAVPGEKVSPVPSPSWIVTPLTPASEPGRDADGVWLLLPLLADEHPATSEPTAANKRRPRIEIKLR
jgi:hypothetical protein